jgi:hypothetical protein
VRVAMEKIANFEVLQFSDKNIAISKNIANNILGIEDQMNKTLHNAVIHLENYLTTNPHPTRQQLVDLSRKLEISGLNFFDINGKEIKNYKFQDTSLLGNEINFSVTDFQDGVYLVIFKTLNNLRTIKLMVQH